MKLPALRGARTWLAPVVLAAAAVGLHFAIHVPRGEYEPRPPKPGSQAKSKGGDAGKSKGFRARRSVRLEELRRQYASVAFDDEPIDHGFARAHEKIVARAVSVARTSAFAGAPDVPQMDTSVACRTVRCRVDACTAFPPELDLFTAAMQSLRGGGRPLFHRVDVEPTTRGALDLEPPGEPCFRLVVSLTRDLPELDAIAVPEPETPARAPRTSDTP